MLNLHCNKKAKKKHKKNKRKIMRLLRFEPKEYGFKIRRGVHYATEADGISR